MQSKLPAPVAADPEDVALALEEAIAHSAAGRKDDALGALARAAEAAERAGMGPRATAIRACRAELGAPAVKAAGSARPPPPSARAAAARASAAPAARSQPPAPGRAAETPSNGAPSNGAVPHEPATTTKVDESNGRRASNGTKSLHVWVRASARDPSLLLVRVLPEGQSAPPGAYEAFLSPADDGTDLLVPKH